jgi:formamidopyrimidine-DNA glycosylase
MPELPEVETVRRVTEPQITGRCIADVTVNNAGVIAHPSAEEFCAALAGKTFTGMGRRGKFLLFSFAEGGRLVLHLRMTGQLLVTRADYPMEKHTHLILKLSDGKEMRYADMRRFGRFWYLADGEEYCVTGMDKLGPEPDDPQVTAAYLAQKCAGKKRAVKEMLLDQSVVAGIGNIYADEILFACRIHPKRLCCELSPQEISDLAVKIPQIIAFYVEKNQIPPEDYLRTGGRDYRNTPYLRVYGHAGEPCPVCGTPLEKITVGGRGSVFCPRCQELKK